jgi:hypothetical protein
MAPKKAELKEEQVFLSMAITTVMQGDLIRNRISGQIFEVVVFTDSMVTMKSEDGLTHVCLELGHLKAFYEKILN